MTATILECPSTTSRPQRKKSAVLLAAGKLFRENGYGNTSMDAVAREADVSKATLYAYFSDKRELFAAVIATEDEVNSRPLSSLEPEQKDIRAGLTHYARTILGMLLTPESVATYRMVMAEAARSPELGRAYYENGAAHLLDRLETVFSAAMTRGQLRRARPRRAAEQFVGLIRGDLQLRALLGMDGSIGEVQLRAVIRDGVDSFCRAYCPRP